MSEVRGGKEYAGDRRHHFIPRQLIVQVGGQADFREQEANARLIASAPDLLAEVERLREQLRIATIALEDLAQEYDNWASVDKATEALAAIRAAGGE